MGPAFTRRGSQVNRRRPWTGSGSRDPPLVMGFLQGGSEVGRKLRMKGGTFWVPWLATPPPACALSRYSASCSRWSRLALQVSILRTTASNSRSRPTTRVPYRGEQTRHDFDADPALPKVRAQNVPERARRGNRNIENLSAGKKNHASHSTAEAPNATFPMCAASTPIPLRAISAVACPARGPRRPVDSSVPPPPPVPTHSRFDGTPICPVSHLARTDHLFCLTWRLARSSTHWRPLNVKTAVIS
jgi:hypothetical protein